MLSAGPDRLRYRLSGGALSDQDSGPEGSSQLPAVKDLPGAWAFVGMGSTIAGSVGFGVLVGLWSDSHFGVAPWGLVIGVLLGSALAVTAVASQVRRYL